LERGRKALPAKWRGINGRTLWRGMVGNSRQDAVRTFRPRSRIILFSNKQIFQNND